MPVRVSAPAPFFVSVVPETVPPSVVSPAPSTVSPAGATMGALIVCSFALSFTMPASMRYVPPMVNAPAVAANVRLCAWKAAFTFGVSRVEPSKTSGVAAPETGITSPTQFAAVLKLSFAPPPSHTGVEVANVSA